jgi:oxygen-independent coproporphyrinogen-3 oxidase
VAESELLTNEQLRDEAIMLAIRMRTGLALSTLNKQGQDNLQAYISTGHIVILDEHIQLTAQGRLIADRLVREALG